MLLLGRKGGDPRGCTPRGQRSPTPYAGINRIRFEGLRWSALSASRPVRARRSPVVRGDPTPLLSGARARTGLRSSQTTSPHPEVPVTDKQTQSIVAKL